MMMNPRTIPISGESTMNQAILIIPAAMIERGPAAARAAPT
jgi:hypothetical protein